MNKDLRKTYAIAFACALMVAGGAFVYKFFLEKPSVVPRVAPSIGAPGSTHLHATFLIFIGNDVADYCSAKYMLRDQHVHMENNDCQVIHKHATGVTFQTFLASVGTQLTSECITFPWNERHCNGGGRTLRTMVNGLEVPINELSFYEIQNNDHILINYGTEEGNELKFKYNQVPMVPPDVNKGEESVQ